MDLDKIKDKIAEGNKMLFYLNNNMLTLPGFCYPFGLKRYSTLRHLLSLMCTRGLLAVKTKDSFALWLAKFKWIVSFSGRLGKIFLLSAPIGTFCFTSGTFNFPPRVAYENSRPSSLPARVAFHSGRERSRTADFAGYAAPC